MAPIVERKKEVKETTEALGWSDDRLAAFTNLIAEYRQTGSIEAYVRVKREYPEVEIQVGRFGGLESLFQLEKTFGKHIDPQLVASALDANEPSIDALSLRLLECLIARSKLPKGGPRHIEKRRDAITDTTVNYLIATMLEALDWNEETFRIPGSLVVLIRFQICGDSPDRYAEYLARQRRNNAARIAVAFIESGGKLSIEKLRTLARVPRSTAARWLADTEFQKKIARLLESGRLLKAKGLL